MFLGCFIFNKFNNVGVKLFKWLVFLSVMFFFVIIIGIGFVVCVVIGWLLFVNIWLELLWLVVIIV